MTFLFHYLSGRPVKPEQGPSLFETDPHIFIPCSWEKSEDRSSFYKTLGAVDLILPLTSESLGSIAQDHFVGLPRERRDECWKGFEQGKVINIRVVLACILN